MIRRMIVLLATVFLLSGVSAYQADFAVYTGSGTWEPSITAFENFLEWKGLTWREVNKNDINYGRLIGNYRGLFMPGGWAGDYNRDIKNSGDQHIRNFIVNGGAYIGMSAGAYYACDVTIWEGNIYDYPSDLFDGECVGPIPEIAPWPEYTMAMMNMNLQHEANIFEPMQRDILYYGEPYFVAYPGQEMQVFASWIVPANPAANGKPGIIGFNYGSGRVLLVGPHPEIDEDSDRDGTNFGDELSDGPDGSDWPFIWTGVDWILKQPILQPPGIVIVPCNDGLDNDLDGAVDNLDFACLQGGFNEDSFAAQCQDWIDNDLDGLIDFPDDSDCDSNQDNDESTPTGPTEIFFDDFEDGNLDGWTKITASGANAWKAASTNSYQGTKHAEAKPQSTSEPASVIERSLNTVGYSDVFFEYYRRLIGLDVGDEFKVEWFDGLSWNVLEQTGSNSVNDASYFYRSFALPPSAGNNLNFKIKFECTAGAVSEFCRVDNVKIIGA